MSTATQDLVRASLTTLPDIVADDEDSVLEMMQDAYAPISLFAVGRADWVEEIAFRALFLVAGLVAAYGVMAAW